MAFLSEDAEFRAVHLHLVPAPEYPTLLKSGIVASLPRNVEVRTRSHTVSHWLWLAGDGYASSSLAATVQSKFPPLRFTHSSRKQETRLFTVLRFAAAFQVRREDAPA